MNKTAAEEWLTKAWHNLSGAILFYEADHYSDVTAVEIHYAVEKTLKSFLAYENQKILRTHDLYTLYQEIEHLINLNDFLDLLEQITKYHVEEAYPQHGRPMPSQSEIKEALNFAEGLFDRVCDILDIDKSEIMRR